jgi:hypothetical protein
MSFKEAKQLYYNRKISDSNKLMKTTWNIIKTETMKRANNKGIHCLNINEKLTGNCKLFLKINW